MIKPDIDTLKELKAQNRYKMAPLSMEILSDLRTPIEVLKILKNVSSHCYLLESVSDHEKWGRYTFLGYDPSLEITCQNGQMKVAPSPLRQRIPANISGRWLRNTKAPSSPIFHPLPVAL